VNIFCGVDPSFAGGEGRVRTFGGSGRVTFKPGGVDRTQTLYIAVAELKEDYDT
jgi:hypothetical protein